MRDGLPCGEGGRRAERGGQGRQGGRHRPLRHGRGALLPALRKGAVMGKVIRSDKTEKLEEAVAKQAASLDPAQKEFVLAELKTYMWNKQKERQEAARAGSAARSRHRRLRGIPQLRRLGQAVQAAASDSRGAIEPVLAYNALAEGYGIGAIGSGCVFGRLIHAVKRGDFCNYLAICTRTAQLSARFKCAHVNDLQKQEMPCDFFSARAGPLNFVR